MSIRVSAGIVLMMAASTIVWAQRPMTYPLRSQSAGQQSVDNAYCYWQAKQQTGVDTARQPQRPFRTAAIQFAPDAGRGISEPPLPASAGQTGAASGANLPPLPPPEPPMTAYWHAFGDCMQSRGYSVR